MKDPPAPPTLYAAFTRTGARLVLSLLAAIFLLSLPAPGGPAHQKAALSGGGPDLSLYLAAVADVRRGIPYDLAAVREQRQRGFPVRPFVTVRPPLLARFLAALPNLDSAVWLLRLLALAVMAAWAFRLREALPGPRRMAWSSLFVFSAVCFAMVGLRPVLLHEVWAGLLIALSLAFRSGRRYGAAVVLGLLAALVRELAMPYLAVMAGFALVERRWREAAAFAAALAVAAVALARHAWAVDALVTARDLASPGWVRFGGWSFVLQATDWNALGVVFGAWTRGLLFPAALIGAWAWKDGRLAAILAGYAAGFLVVGRSNTTYWGLLITPLIGVGLALALVAYRDLWLRAGRPLSPRER